MLWREIQQSVAAQKALGVDISGDRMLQGLLLARAHNNTPRVSEADITAALEALTARFKPSFRAKKQKQAGQKWPKEFLTRKGVISDKGSFYLVSEIGSGPRLKTSDTAELLVTGCLADGTVCDRAGELG